MRPSGARGALNIQAHRWNENSLRQFSVGAGGLFPFRGAHTMTKSILVSLAILTLSTSVVLAAQRTQSRAVKPSAPAAATNPNAAFARMGPSPVIFAPGVSNSD